ncbi:MAG: hypothetical protein AAGB05_10320 [Pseudomonadota bacterium]
MRLTAVLLATLALAGCESRLNPFNWFGQSQETTVPVAAAEAPTIAPRDPRPTVSQIASLTIDRVPGGALVTATAIPATQGWFETGLVPARRSNTGVPIVENGELTLRFVAVPPRTGAPVGSERSREVTAGIFLSDQTLEDVRTITVRGAQNQRSSRR